MFVIWDGHSWADVDAHVDNLPSRDADVVPLQLGTMDSRLLCQCRLEHECACEGQCCTGNDSSRFHGKPLRRYVLVSDALFLVNRQLKMS
jgi:hypothetical protein